MLALEISGINNMNDKATKYYKKLFPNLKSTFPKTDPEFYNFWHNFMYDEIINTV